MILTIGSRSYSSWSMRPWLAARQTDIPIVVKSIPFRCEGTTRVLDQATQDALAVASPSSLVPVLEVNGVRIWDSLAICEFLAESFPERNLWPAHTHERAVARSVSAEMHSGFSSLRAYLPFCPKEQVDDPVDAFLPEQVRLDIRRIDDIWSECRSKFGARGRFLFGPFSIADAMFAPVAIRFSTYRIGLSNVAREYVQTILDLQATGTWIEDARSESDRIVPIDELVRDFKRHVVGFRTTELAGRTVQ
ncbi:glutathione S-transferase [Mesorhizobium sp.]|uniref:glutathione S-transferase n=1 Tax=Mesorhizobium sp. TaxID=1871066 RepID=UPI000FEA55B6|nr:glutathione S-transferase [Mesorhizobium sp.]RWK47479.1 MAG: glutathione S-transferase [Mesorhizobium sp.]